VLHSALESAPQGPVDWASVFVGAERACCCSARPAVVAVFPARPADPTQLTCCCAATTTGSAVPGWRRRARWPTACHGT